MTRQTEEGWEGIKMMRETELERDDCYHKPIGGGKSEHDGAESDSDPRSDSDHY